jgi:hypothetical protein
LNKDSVYDYDKGALPRTDELFARAVIQAIPSGSSDRDVGDMIEAYRRAAEDVMG